MEEMERRGGGDGETMRESGEKEGGKNERGVIYRREGLGVRIDDNRDYYY